MLNFDHPNIVKVHKIINEQNDTNIFIVMDYISSRYGGSLDLRLQKAEQGFSEAHALYYFH